MWCLGLDCCSYGRGQKGMRISWGTGGKLKAGKRQLGPFGKIRITDISRMGYWCCLSMIFQTVLPAKISQSSEKKTASGILLPWVLLCLLNLRKIHNMAPGMALCCMLEFNIFWDIKRLRVQHQRWGSCKAECKWNLNALWNLWWRKEFLRVERN